MIYSLCINTLLSYRFAVSSTEHVGHIFVLCVTFTLAEIFRKFLGQIPFDETVAFIGSNHCSFLHFNHTIKKVDKWNNRHLK